ncbi:DUF6541 family protein [Arthrobacter sp. TMN-49]
MNWFDTVPTLLVAAALIFLPGAILARALGARGITWLALSAPLTMSLIGSGAIFAQSANIRWTPIVLLIVTMVVAGAALGIRYLVEIKHRKDAVSLWVRPPNATVAGLIGGLTIAAAVLGWRLTRVFISPENISQTYDNVFHLNAVRYILDTGNASSMQLASLDPLATGSFYPAVWHGLVSLVAQLAGSTIPVSLNASNIIIGSLVWTISSMYLTTRVLGSRPAVYLMTGALAGAFSAFPYLLLGFGVLYPNFLAIALLPVAIGLVADVLRVTRVGHPGTLRGLILLIALLPGLTLSHPSIAIVLGAFALPLIAYWFYMRLRAAHVHELAWPWLMASVAAIVAYSFILKFVWDKFRPSEKASFWLPTQTIAQALGEAVANAPMRGPISWVVVCLTVIGLYALVRSQKQVWLVGTLAVGTFLYVVVSGFEEGALRTSLTGVFYNDSYRLAALLPVIGIAVAVFGTIWLFDLACLKLQANQVGHPRRWVSALTVGSLAAAGLGVMAQDNSVDSAVERARSGYSISPEAPLLSTNEAALIARVHQTIPADATVIANPATGASLVYALGSRHVLLPAVSSSPTPQEMVILRHLSEMERDPKVCDAITSLNSFYLLDFGSQQINEMDKPFPTSEQLAQTTGLTLLDQEGHAKLYRIDGC